MVMNSRIFTAALVLLAGTSGSFARRLAKSAPAVQSFNFDISKFSAAPDGYTADVLGVNKMMNVPIIVNKGDTISVTANNHLNEPTAIHFHGMLQNATNWYDGASMVTQCPIQPGSNLTYQFTVNDQHGTYWWHAHHNSQYVQGLRGPLIIRDPDNEPFTKDYDSEIIVKLTDWFHDDKDTLLAQFFAVNGNGDEPMPDSALINDKGQYNCSVAAKKNNCVDNSALEVFNITKGERVRFRIINMSAMATFLFSFDGHKMDVIEADGIDTVKTTVDELRINTAQRYSVIVNMDQAETDYWVRATIDVSQWAQNVTNGLNPEVKAILHYGGNTTVPKSPTTTPGSNLVRLDPMTLLPYSYPATPPDYTMGLAMRFDIASNDKNVTTAVVTVGELYTNEQYLMPTGNPTLIDVMNGNKLPNSSVAVSVQRDTVVELSIWNDDAVEHIFHLHGHRFWVVAAGASLNAGIKPPTANASDTERYPVRDTIAVPACHVRTGNTGEGICGGGLGYVRIRFIANNPGVWLLHCHMEWHMAAGLAFTVVVDEETLMSQKALLPKAISDGCSA